MIEKSDLIEMIYILKENLSKASPLNSAIAYSGGLDSSVLMYLGKNRYHAYTAGFPGSIDLVNSIVNSSILGFTPTSIIIDDSMMRNAVDAIRKIDPSVTMQELGYESVLYLVLKNIKEDCLVTGQGADEIFYGYRRLVTSTFPDNSMDLKRLFEITLNREERMASALGKKLITPFVDRRIIDLASAINSRDHVDGSQGKLVLRELAKLAGMEKRIYTMNKKAAQYGSGTDRWIRKNIELHEITEAAPKGKVDSDA